MNDRDATPDRGRALLRLAVGSDTAEFRPGQWEAIDAVVNRRRRVLVIQRTGWGKSAVYFIATRLLRDRGLGPTLIVSPLLALMRNQIDAAKGLGLTPLSINSTNRKDWPSLQQAVLSGHADALLISPERLANDDLVRDVLLPITQRVGLLVVDEAHCISDWGHDFRPDYRRLVSILQRMPPNMPALGTTATANGRVVADIRGQLGDIDVQRGQLTRSSLALQTLRLPDQAARLAWMAEHLPRLPGTGIVYTLTKRDADRVAGWLTANGISARAYYSGVIGDDLEDTDAYRIRLEGLLLENRIKALVATSALGMGYDKPDLTFVIHYQAPGSIISYYQQVGRAGRAIDSATVVLLAGREDGEIQDYFRNTAFPDEQHVGAILHALGSSEGLTQRQMEEIVNLRQGQIEQALKFLAVESPSPVLKEGTRWHRTPVEYRMDRDRIARLNRQREEEWRDVQNYIDSPDCLMQFLAQALDDADVKPCGRCARCLARPLVPASFTSRLGAQATRYLRQSELPLECRRQVAADAFPEYGSRGNLPPAIRAETGRILSRWGDAGWGRHVEDGKRAGNFSDELVGAAVELIRDRWTPQPNPTWVTCVPSHRHPELVPDFSRRLAQGLGLPFLAAVTKRHENAPQKLQQNRFHQCRNLDGAFAVGVPLPVGPVLLVDDVVDSAWTMTIVAALLRQAGSGPVWPFALTTTRAGD